MSKLASVLPLHTLRPLHRLFVAAALLVAVVPAGARRVPSLVARDLSGGKRSLASLRGKIVVLSYWATWCAPCQEELPRLSQLSLRYAGRDVEFVAVSIDEPKDWPKIQPFFIRNDIRLKAWVGANADSLKTFGLGEIVPGTVVLDMEGEPVGRIMGEAKAGDIESRLDWLLSGRQGPAPEARTKRY